MRVEINLILRTTFQMSKVKTVVIGRNETAIPRWKSLTNGPKKWTNLRIQAINERNVNNF